VIRGGVGMFYIRFPNMDELFTREYNGLNQISYVVNNPGFYAFPTLPADFVTQYNLTATSNEAQFITGNNLRTPYLIQSAIGVERQLAKGTTLAVNVTDTRGVRQFVTSEIGTAPDGAKLFQFQSDGLLKQLQVITRVNTQIGTRVSLFGAYIWSTAHSNTDGALCPSSSGCGTSTPVDPYDLSAEWGRSALAVTSRMFLAGTYQAPLRIQLAPFITASSGMPFNITTGSDYLGDGIYNARPAFASGPGPNIVATPYGYLNSNPTAGETLIPRNYGTGPSQYTVNLRLSRTWGFGPTKFAGSSGGARAGMGGGGGPRGGPMGGMGGMGGRGGFGGGTTEHRYNLTLSISARNMLNHVNYSPPVGVMGTPFFLQSTTISGGYMAEATPTDNRRIDAQLRFQF
jgi:hypothetical protein